MPTIEVRLFGSVRVRPAGDSRDIGITRSLQQLLSFMILNRAGAHPRERLADTLWRDVDPVLGRSRLSTAMWRLRRQLNECCGCDIFEATAAGDLRLSDGVDLWLDVAEFERAATAFLRTPAGEADGDALDTVERGLDHFRHELMEGHYCDWVMEERLRLNGLKERCLSHLIAVYTAADRDEEVIARGLDLLAIDPLREDAHQAVMSAQLRLGRPHLARRQYEFCRETLARELGVEPVSATRNLQVRSDRRAAGTIDAAERSELLAIKSAISAAEDHLRNISLRIDRLLSP